MITIQFKETELYDSETNTFEVLPAKVVSFEYSLKAIYEWEARWRIPFLSTEMRANDVRLLDFYSCMAVGEKLILNYITPPIMKILNDYIKDEPTATNFSQNGNTNNRSGKVYTAEEIYALMSMQRVPIEFEDRNINRLLIILRIISVYSTPPKKMTQRETMEQNMSLNERRKQKYNTRG